MSTFFARFFWVFLLFATPALAQQPGVTERLPWHDDGVWLHGDTHIHRLDRGEKSRPIVSAAAAAGLDFIASTEHAQSAISTRSIERLEELRRRYPDLIMLAGVEWNVPGAGHASVIVEKSPREWEVLETFSARYDRKVSRGLSAQEPEHDDHTWGSLDRAKKGLEWLNRQMHEGGPRTVAFLNHPSRGHYVTDEQVIDLIAAGLAGIEGSPGHQRRDPPGTPDTIDRHEPFVAVVGGGYDKLLASGKNTGLVAGSDYHISVSSYLPGFFSRSLVYCPDRTPEGIVKGLAAGSTATITGNIVRSLETRTTFEGLDDAALIGEVLQVPRGRKVTYTIEYTAPGRDANGGINRIDRVEIISNWRGLPEIVKVFEKTGLGEVRLDYELPAEATTKPGNFYLRARGRKIIGDDTHNLKNADLMFYTGGTRVRVLE